jgi:hypothetical protein
MIGKGNAPITGCDCAAGRRARRRGAQLPVALIPRLHKIRVADYLVADHGTTVDGKGVQDSCGGFCSG